MSTAVKTSRGKERLPNEKATRICPAVSPPFILTYSCLLAGHEPATADRQSSFRSMASNKHSPAMSKIQQIVDLLHPSHRIKLCHSGDQTKE